MRWVVYFFIVSFKVIIYCMLYLSSLKTRHVILSDLVFCFVLTVLCYIVPPKGEVQRVKEDLRKIPW